MSELGWHMDDGTEARAARRRQTWQASVRRDGAHAPAGRMSPEAGLAVMWELALSAWTLTGRSLPTYTRADMPGRLLVNGQQR